MNANIARPEDYFFALSPRAAREVIFVHPESKMTKEGFSSFSRAERAKGDSFTFGSKEGLS
jgi:hypothetical protein